MCIFGVNSWAGSEKKMFSAEARHCEKNVQYFAYTFKVKNLRFQFDVCDIFTVFGVDFLYCMITLSKTFYLYVVSPSEIGIFNI